MKEGFKKFLILAMACLLGGCMSMGEVGPAPQRLDLGAASNVSGGASAGTLPTLVIPPLASASVLQGVSVIWRVGNEGEPRRYATYEWVAAPENLVRERL